MNDLISIVVPIYNVENYLKNCVDSILNQTYSNLEVILVNDGSTDKCESIIEYYKNKDKRVIAIHKKNGGLSDARNVGIDIATGKYIMFVDSDDYISLDCVEYLYKCLIVNNAEISIGKLKTTSNLKENIMESEKYHHIFSMQEGLNQIFYAKHYSVAAPGKLYLKSLFDDIRFPIGKLHEDVFTTYKVFLKVNRIYYGEKTVYFYYHRAGSITTSKFNERRLHILEALNQIEKDIPINEYGCIKGFASQNIETMYMLLGLKPNQYIIKKYKIWEKVKKYRKIVIFDKNCSKRVRGYAIISYLGMRLSSLIYIMYQKIKWS